MLRISLVGKLPPFPSWQVFPSSSSLAAESRLSCGTSRIDPFRDILSSSQVWNVKEKVDEFKDFREISERKQKPLVRMTHSKSFKHHYRLLVRRLRKGKTDGARTGRSGETFRVEALLRAKLSADSRGGRLQVIHSALFSRSCGSNKF